VVNNRNHLRINPPVVWPRRKKDANRFHILCEPLKASYRQVRKARLLNDQQQDANFPQVEMFPEDLVIAILNQS
jgi:hypothetical protein